MNIQRCSGIGLGDLLKDKSNPIGIEIGCSEGDTTCFLLESNQTLKITSIDPYVAYQDWNRSTLSDRPAMYDHTMRRMQSYITQGRFEMIRDYSDNAIDRFEDESLDFIFIDGLHTYEQVKLDCNNYYRKLKSGGLFSGHDFTVIDEVNRAVKEFASSVNRMISTTDIDVWYWYKL